MGARIAAHLANAGVPSYLLDIVPPDADGPARNKIAQAGLDGAVKSRPAAFFEPSLAKLVTVGNFDDNLKWVSRVRLGHRSRRRKRGHQALPAAARLSRSASQGRSSPRTPADFPSRIIAEGFSDEFRRFWFGTHFFNPPRYMRLLELIPTPDSDPVRHGCHRPLLRCASRQRYCLGEGHAKLYRQSYRHLLCT